MAWTNADTFKFIALYRSEPAIWNPKDSLHKDKSVISEGWDRISAQMKTPIEVLKKKKETLMTAFRLNHKKKLASLKTGDPRDLFTPTWSFYEPMAEFLAEIYDDQMMQRSGIVCSDDGASSSTAFQNKWNPVVEIGVEEVSNDAFLEEQPASKRRRSSSPEPSSSSSEKYLTNTMTTLATVMNLISKDMVERQKASDNEDECDLFGRLIAMKLKNIPDSERWEMMYEIDTMFMQKRFKNEPL